jgi:hypothetical protein
MCHDVSLRPLLLKAIFIHTATATSYDGNVRCTPPHEAYRLWHAACDWLYSNLQQSIDFALSHAEDVTYSSHCSPTELTAHPHCLLMQLLLPCLL